MQDIVDSARDLGNIQRSRFILDAELLKWANDARAELRDIFVNSNQGYFADFVNFSFNAGTKIKSLASITTGIPDDAQTSLANFSLLAGTVAAVTTLQHIYTFTAADFPMFDAEITEAFLMMKFAYPSPTNLGTDTTFSIEVNGVVSSIAAVIPDAGTSPVSDDDHYVRVNLGTVDQVTGNRTGTDTVKIVCTCAGAPVTPWNAGFRVNFLPIQPDSKFYKELALSYGQGNERVEIQRLDVLADRNRVSGPRFWISGENLELYCIDLPATTFTLDYVPTFQSLALTDEIEVQFERCVEYLVESVVGDIKFKRNLLDEQRASLQRLATIAARITPSLPRRSNGPKRIPMPAKDIFARGVGRRRW